MYTNINFLKERNRQQELVLMRDKKLAVLTAIALGIFLFVTVSLFSYQVFLNLQLQKISKVFAQETAVMQSLNKRQESYLDLKSKLKTLGGIMQKRGSKWEAISFVYGLLPPGVTISSVDLESGASNQLTFSIQANSVFSFEALSKVLQSSAITSSGYAIELGTLTRSKDGSYRLDVTMKNI